QKVFGHTGAIDLSEKLCASLVISRVSARGCEPIGGQCQEVRDRQFPSHILYVRIKTAVLVFRDLYRPGIIRSEHLEEGCRSHASDSKLLCAVEKLSPMNFTMNIPVE